MSRLMIWHAMGHMICHTIWDMIPNIAVCMTWLMIWLMIDT